MQGRMQSAECTVQTAVLAALVLIAGCAPGAPTAPAALDQWFSERAVETGLDFIHVNGASGRFFYPEILAPGVGLLDYDNDGDLDVYLVQGRTLGTPLDQTPPSPATAALKGRLYRNDLRINADGSRQLQFTDVTDASGIHAGQYGLGVAAADVDNDGWIDLLLTNFGTNQLLRNNGDGR